MSPRLAADAELHAAPVLRDVEGALCHDLLDGDGAFHGPHGARELRQNTVAGRVDDCAAELPDHRQHHGLMRLQIAHRRGLVSPMSRE